MGFVLISLNWYQMCLNHVYLYLLLLIQKLMIFALTTNAITVFILYLYLYLLKSLYLLEFIVVYIFIEVECIYLNYVSTVIIGLVFICGIYIYWVGSNFLLFNTCTIKFIEGKFYFEGRACYIGKIMPTCIE